jgi:hypothetical protein
MSTSNQDPHENHRPVGLAEVALVLDVKRSTADMWRYRELLPPERWTISGSPVWCLQCDIEAWARTTKRLP